MELLRCASAEKKQLSSQVALFWQCPKGALWGQFRRVESINSTIAIDIIYTLKCHLCQTAASKPLCLLQHDSRFTQVGSAPPGLDTRFSLQTSVF
jgi:hypothetical protein